MSVSHFGILGGYLGDGDDAENERFDAVDLFLETSDGPRIAGMRSSKYMFDNRLLDDDGVAPTWKGDYRPIPTTIRRSDIKSFNFQKVLWLGPDEHACLFWSNYAMNAQAISTFWAIGQGNVFAGPDRRGLPTPDQLGLEIPENLALMKVVAPTPSQR